MSKISSNKENFVVPLLLPKRLAAIQRVLLRWYAEKGRDLPWRHTRDPYKVLVSEIMLQQTQVDRVIPKYQAFLKAFPTVEKLARARRSRVIQCWAGLGYNRRAVYLHEAAKKVLRDFDGVMPITIDALRTLPGVGDYTAGAVAAFTGGSKTAFLDTNIKRVLGRLFFNTKKKRLPAEKKLAEYAQSLVPTKKDEAYFWHHAHMDLGALVCTAAKPKCETCPLKRVCPFPLFRDTIKKSHYAKPQPTFKNSDRFWRGRILDAVRRKKRGVTLGYLKSILVIPPTRAEKITQGLIRDGLVVRIGSTLSLPE
ncbi:MAG: A/G-specific adenine glycosylase [bacterium]|nr:A/G-specific adenine glycosylase [bacterium]